MQFVIFPAVQGIVIGIFDSPSVLRSAADHPFFHRWRDAGGGKVVHDITIEIEHTGLLFEFIATKERKAPGAVRIVVISRLPDLEGHRTCRRIAHRCGLGENLLHPLIRREWFALYDPYRGIEAKPDRVEGIARLLLYDLIEQLPEGIVSRGYGIEILARKVHELDGR